MSIIIMIITIVGIFGTQFRKVYRWDDAAEKVLQLEMRVRAAETSNAVVMSQLSEISKQLDQVNWQLRRIDRGRNP